MNTTDRSEQPAGTVALALASSSALRRKNEVLRLREKQLSDWKAHADRIEADNDRLRAALRPFAEIVPPRTYGNDVRWGFGDCKGSVRCGDFRAARRALGPNTKVSHDHSANNP